MGVIKQGILGGFSNKVGSVVGSSWKGIATMRAMPLSVANPRTTKQVTNRTSFAFFSVKGAEVLSSVIQPLWNRWAKRMSGYNEWLSVNKKAFDAAASLSAYLPNAKFAVGDLSSSITSASMTSGGVTTFTWPTGLVNAKDANTDEAYFVIIAVPDDLTSIDDVKIYGVATAYTRSTGTGTTTISDYSSDYSYYGYLMFRGADGTSRSETGYKGITLP